MKTIVIILCCCLLLPVIGMCESDYQIQARIQNWDIVQEMSIKNADLGQLEMAISKGVYNGTLMANLTLMLIVGLLVTMTSGGGK